MYILKYLNILVASKYCGSSIICIYDKFCNKIKISKTSSTLYPVSVFYSFYVLIIISFVVHFGSGAQIGNVLTFPISGVLCDSGFDGGWSSIFYVIGMSFSLFV